MTYLSWQRIESQADQLGFRIGNPKAGQWGTGTDANQVAIYPKDDALPVYNRDTELFVGSFRELSIWLAGWARAQQYDTLLRLSDDKKRKTAEDRERERDAVVPHVAEPRAEILHDRLGEDAQDLDVEIFDFVARENSASYAALTCADSAPAGASGELPAVAAQVAGMVLPGHGEAPDIGGADIRQRLAHRFDDRVVAAAGAPAQLLVGLEVLGLQFRGRGLDVHRITSSAR